MVAGTQSASADASFLLAILATLEPLDEHIGEIADFPPEPFDFGSQWIDLQEFGRVDFLK